MPDTIEAEVVELERQYWQALRDGDEETPPRLSDDPCIVSGAQGISSLDEHAVANMMKQLGWKLRSFEIDPNMIVRVIGENIALLAYKVHQELAVDSRLLKFDALDTSTWVRRNGRWRCVLHTEAIAGDPFGRDRLSA